MFAKRSKEIFVGDSLVREVSIENPPLFDQKRGGSFEKASRALAAPSESGGRRIDREEGRGGDDAADQRCIRPDHGVLDSVGEEEEEKKIERRELPYLTLPREAKPHEERQVNDRGSRDDFEERVRRREPHTRSAIGRRRSRALRTEA